MEEDIILLLNHLLLMALLPRMEDKTVVIPLLPRRPTVLPLRLRLHLTEFLPVLLGVIIKVLVDRTTVRMQGAILLVEADLGHQVFLISHQVAMELQINHHRATVHPRNPLEVMERLVNNLPV